MSSNGKYDKYVAKMQKIADLGYSIAVLNWDQEVYLPKKSTKYRAQQIATLSGLSHEFFVEEELGDILNELSDSNTLDERQAANIRESLKDYRLEKKYPTEFVVNMAKTTSLAATAWKDAREKNDFKLFEKDLHSIIDLKREETELLGYEDHPYDCLLDRFEPYTTTKDIEAVFKQVKNELVDFTLLVLDKPKVEDSFIRRKFKKDKQWDFGLELLKQMGYDFSVGRQDISTHPFTTSFNAMDVRITTRINEHDLKEMIWSTIHEGGHALYEQGLDADEYGLPVSEAVSLGLHESQSRLWENNVARGMPYWKANYPLLQSYFEDSMKDTSLEDFYRAINAVEASCIRTSADELTYHMHILIRFELEKSLIENDLQVKDLPEAWNQKYKSYLNLDIPTDNDGVLQDIHWSGGAIGYFPTYSLGSFYAAQFYQTAKEQIDGLESDIEQGKLKSLLTWLRENIHQHGRIYPAKELCKRVTGEPLNFKYFMDYVKEKFGKIYNIN